MDGNDKFFSAYERSVKREEGVPGIAMNRPVYPHPLPFLGQIGLELEVEAKTPLPKDRNLESLIAPRSGAKWLAITDGSLRGEAREYIVTVPIFRDEVPHMIGGLFDLFKEMNVELDNSNRCSTHVHLNVSTRKVNELTSFIILWGIFETALIRWCGEERQTNHFCLSFKDTSAVINSWDKFLRTGERSGFDTRGANPLKYSAFNISPITGRGSVEIRCGRAADSREFPIKWAMFLDTFSKYAFTVFANPGDIAAALSEKGALEIFQEICAVDDDLGEDFFNEILNDQAPSDFDRECLEGFRRVQRLSLGYPWYRWMPLINKVYVPNPFSNKPTKTKEPRHHLNEIENLLRDAGREDELRAGDNF